MNLKNLTHARCKALHKEMWLWLAKHPDCMKLDWPRWKRNGGDVSDIQGDCFACFVVREKTYGCNVCPLGKENIGCRVGLFRAWSIAKCYGRKETTSKLATEIANLPWKICRKKSK